MVYFCPTVGFVTANVVRIMVNDVEIEIKNPGSNLVCVLLPTTTLGKGLNPYILSVSLGK